jgi:hypothetical protein
MVHRTRHLGFSGHVQLQEPRTRDGIRDGHSARIDVGEEHVGTFRSTEPRSSLADTARGPRDQNNLARQQSRHRRLPYFRLG